MKAHTIRYFKGNKTFKQAESIYSPIERLEQLRKQHKYGTNGLEWTNEKGLQWEIVSEKKAKAWRDANNKEALRIDKEKRDKAQAIGEKLQQDNRDKLNKAIEATTHKVNV